jgi:hypothetical protein
MIILCAIPLIALLFACSEDDGDFADNNIIRGNIFTNSARTIRDDGKANSLVD